MDALWASQFPSQAQCNPYIHLVKQSLAEVGITSPERVLGMFVADLRLTNSLFGALASDAAKAKPAAE